jgi:serine/threonine protein kinase
VTIKVGERYRERYQVLGRVGEGAFAQVYRARDLTAERDVALKVLKDPYLTVKDVVERFQREVFAVASISSPHVVRLWDFGISDDDFYLVTEFVEGPSLRELMGARPWTATDVHVIVGQIAHALAAAHKQDIVHRDLKPENVVLVEKPGGWQVKVLDFGFAKLPELERKLGLQPLTRKGHLFGTPQYLSPEQIRGKPLDGGADLFALGVITYEMLAGRRPWDGPDPREVMVAVLKQLPPAVTRLHATMAPRLEEVNRFLERALAKEREERPADAGAFFEELGQALFPGAIPALPRELDAVSSHSIELQLNPRPRRDQTEVTLDDDRQTVQFATERSRSGQRKAVTNDTIKQDAFDSSKIIVDGSSDIPIFVGGGEPTIRLPSGFHAAPAGPGTDSQKATLPRSSMVPERRGSFGRALLLFLVIVVVAGAAFWLGRALR